VPVCNNEKNLIRSFYILRWFGPHMKVWRFVYKCFSFIVVSYLKYLLPVRSFDSISISTRTCCNWDYGTCNIFIQLFRYLYSNHSLQFINFVRFALFRAEKLYGGRHRVHISSFHKQYGIITRNLINEKHTRKIWLPRQDPNP
jgi:hypothetical protein